MDILEITISFLLLGYLFAAALLDHRKGKIPLWLPAVGFVCGFVLRMIQGSIPFYMLLLGSLVGVLLLLLAKLTREAIGYGDGLIFLSSGAFCGLAGNLLLLLLSLSAAALFTIPLLLFRKRKRNDRLPFLPFVLAGYVIYLILYV